MLYLDFDRFLTLDYFTIKLNRTVDYNTVAF